MKSSFFHYLKEIVLYGVIVPILTVIVGFRLFTTFYPISDSLLTDFLKAFTEQRILAIVFVLILCFIFFGSIYYCISCGRNRKLIPDKVYTQITNHNLHFICRFSDYSDSCRYLDSHRITVFNPYWLDCFYRFVVATSEV